MSGDSATETTPPRRSWTVWIWRGGIMLLFALPLIYAFALLLAQRGIRLVESSGGYAFCSKQASLFDPFQLHDEYNQKYAFLRIDRDVEHVDLRNSWLRSDQVKILNRFPKLRSLLINSNHMGPELKLLAAKGLPLKLTVSGSPLRTDGIEAFAHLKRLDVINVSGRMDLNGVTRMPKLEVLCLRQKHILTGVDLAPLVACPRLELLNLNADLDESAWQVLARCSTLKKINLSSLESPHSWKGLSALAGVLQLRELSLGNMTRESLRELTSVTQIKTLHIESGEFELEDLRLLAGLKNLESFTMRLSALNPVREKQRSGSRDLYDSDLISKQAQELLSELFPQAKVELYNY